LREPEREMCRRSARPKLLINELPEKLVVYVIFRIADFPERIKKVRRYVLVEVFDEHDIGLIHFVLTEKQRLAVWRKSQTAERRRWFF
jgi:hypothetical protein